MKIVRKPLLLLVVFFSIAFVSISQTYIPCGFCKGSGKQILPLPCTNCENWSAEYKRKMPCHVCKDKRTTPPKGKCIVCEGAGKINLSELTGTKTPVKKANLKKENQGTYLKRALQNVFDQDYETALGNCNNELQLYPKEVKAYTLRGLVKVKLYDLGGAIDDANKAIAISPKASDAYFVRGIAKKQLTEKTGACLDLNKALELGFEGAKEHMEGYCDSQD